MLLISYFYSWIKSKAIFFSRELPNYFTVFIISLCNSHFSISLASLPETFLILQLNKPRINSLFPAALQLAALALKCSLQFAQMWAIHMT